MKKVLLLIPLLFVMMVGSAFASTYAPTQSQLESFKTTYGNGYVIQKMQYITQTDDNTVYLAVPNDRTITATLDTATGDLNITATKTGYIPALLRDGEVYTTKTIYTTPTKWDGSVNSVLPLTIVGGEFQLKGVGLEEIPGQMVGTGGIVLPTVLIAFAALLIVGLVRRFPRWFHL